jgi:serine/threonine/tyrosine-interacting protein
VINIYTYRLRSWGLTLLKPPSPPHIHIPPIPEDEGLVLPPFNGSLLDAEIKDPESREILKIITRGHFEVKVKEWKYESRRQAQPILAFLYLGPSGAAKNIVALREEGITMLLVIRDTRSAMSGLLSGEKVANQLGIDHATVDVDGNAELIHSGFPNAISIINNHLVSKYRQYANLHPSLDTNFSPAGKPTTWGKVLVFCESGNERSAAVAVAYLMAVYDLDMVRAIQFVQAQRFCIAFDDNLKNLLLNYEQILEARRSVLAAQREGFSLLGQHAPTLVVKPKRVRDEIDDVTEMTMDNRDDGARFEGRRSFAPFYS